MNQSITNTRTLFACLLLATIFFPCVRSVAVEARPNIILMMADDMGMGDSSAYQDFTGNADAVQVHTPQMEQLARMGTRFTDAHTPSSRCSPTRYGLLTGRYPWRNRLKHWVLFGAQGDPMIEADRPTLASMLRGENYATAMVGKWHVGLRYRQSDGSPAAGWEDADLSKPLHTSPLNHGFEFARFTSRSHGTSGPNATSKKAKKKKGPGHVHGQNVVGSTGDGKKLANKGPDAYVLTKLGGRHSDHALGFLAKHVSGADTRERPFFLYYASNSNHAPYTPDKEIGGVPVAGAARTKSGKAMDRRHDFVYENDVALGRMLDWLEETDDPRSPGSKLIETTLVVFTSDNGAEVRSKTATGPFRSHKGSVYEGGHRVPFIVSWPAGGVGKGQSNDAPISLQDLYATFAEALGSPLPDLRSGKKGAEDSHSVLSAFRGNPLPRRPPLFFNDHSEAKRDRAAAAIRIDSPRVGGEILEGKWKLFFDATLLRSGQANPYELYNLATDPMEQTNLIENANLKPLIRFMTAQALLHRNVGGHRLTEFAPSERTTIDWRRDGLAATDLGSGLKVRVNAERGGRLNASAIGLGISGGDSDDVDAKEALLVRFDRDVIVESVSIVAGDGVCGGFYQVGDAAPLAIYCIDADNDAQDQSGILSDIGVLRAGQILRLDSSPHYGVEAEGRWRLATLTVRVLKP